jgi:membrane fusion protein (multidrug efflux system)
MLQSRVLLLCLLATLVAGCDKKSQKAEAPAPSVVVTTVERKTVDVGSEWVGTTSGFVNAQIYPKIQGYLLKQTYKAGPVKSGDLLFEIDPRQYQAAFDAAKGEFARVRAILIKNQQDVKRYTPLAAQGAVSQMELDSSIQAAAASKAQLDSAQAALDDAKLNLDWTKVKSPIDGVAGIASAQVGDLVSTQTLLTSISQLDPIKVSVQVSEIDYLRFAKRAQERADSGEAQATVPLTLILADGSQYPEKGHFNVAGLDVTKTTGTIELECLFPNPQNLLRPGQFAKVRASTESLQDALVIPQRAVTDLQGTMQVAVVGPDDKVVIKRVTLGPTTGSNYVVTDGLEAGDRVIVEGLQKVRNGMVVKIESAPEKNAVAAPAPASEKTGN